MNELSTTKVRTSANKRLARGDDEGRQEVIIKGGVYPNASDGVPLPSDSLAQILAYNGDGTLLSITVAYLGNTYVQTYSYTQGKVTGISQWVKQ